MTDTLRNQISKATSIGDLFDIFDATIQPSSTPSPTIPSGTSSRAKANEKAMEILKRTNGDFRLITDEDRDALREYTGWGGIGGSTNEYYTPPLVAKATWSALEAYGFKNGNVLEPAAGVGVFAETKPEGVIMTSVEMEKISSSINQILHPEDTVINSSFEDFATNNETGGYEAVIGNPPYGSRDESAHKDDEYKKIALADQYFVTRSIDKAAPGGLIALILPTRIVDRKSLSKWRTSISLKAEFLGAHRLPSDIFGAAGTAVVTDLVIWRKHTDETIDIIDAASVEELKESNVLWDTWINGKWFEKDGKPFINGTQQTIGEGKFKRLVVDRGGRTDQQIAKSMSHKFDSRIDWGALSTVEPLTNVYGEGDSRMINGKMMRFVDGQWTSVSPVTNTGQVDVNVYGLENDTDAAKITASPEGILKLSFSNCKAIRSDLGYVCSDEFKASMKAAGEVNEKHQERVFRGITIGRMVRTLSDLVANGTEEQITEYRKKVAAAVKAEFDLFGSTRKIRNLRSLPDEQYAEWAAFDSAFNDDGELSDLLTGDLKKSDAKQYNLSEPDDVLLWFNKQASMKAVSFEEFRTAYNGKLKDLPDEEMFLQLASMPNVAINSDGTLSSLHHATSGNVVERLEHLNQSIANSDNPALTANYQRQIDLINKKRNKISINDMRMKLTDKWIPKEIMLEFLHDSGYNEFVLGRTVEIEEEEHFDTTYRGPDATFTGYRTRDGQKRNNQEENFERQIESYINDGSVRGGAGNAGKAAVRDQIRALDDDFTNWLASSDYADQLEELYNNVFNGYIEPEYDTESLELEGVSGAIEFMGFQNATIRRHSDDGNGIVGFGTGLGKTLTGYGLITYNLQKGRSKRTVVVVPKSVLENWFHEGDLFYGEKNLADKVFIGIEPEYDSDGKLVREPVYDQDGEQKLDKKGDPIMRAKLTVDTSSKKVAPALHALTQSKASVVVMTKDVYNSIPMRDSTIADNVEEMVDAGLVAKSNKYVQVATKHREKEKNNKFKAKYADEGTKKKNALPYYEDLLFDSVLVDEGHDFRNSYKTGSFGNRLAFMPGAAQADRALDMQIKNNYLKRRNNGRGVYMLTATPTVNSPVDAFNMLSQVIPPEVFAKMGITDGDDFIRLFGRTGETAVHKLSGDVETKEALLGFQNLDALRNLFHRYVTIKDIKDVNSEVHIPDLETKTSYVEMSEEQKEIYETLRERAEALSNPDSEEAKIIAEEYPDDSVFSIIRQMDKACTDLDLYKGVITYRFPKSKEVEVRELIDSIPKTITVKRPVYDEKSGKYKNKKVTIESDVSITVEGKHVVVVANQELDSNIDPEAQKRGLTFSHPVAPKYAKFLDNAKDSYINGGKQLVFTEEKTQHIKLARIISQYVGCGLDEIGIINSDSVAGKKGASVDELDDAGLEAIAAEYNTGRYKFVILNKKGEVGINLHIGTTDIHHLTLPFTPASLTQRNGRGARVGSQQASVNVHYYAGKGSFDKFRIATIERKARWISDLFNGGDSYVENGDAADANETAIMLAADPEEARRRQEEADVAREKKLAIEKQRVASISAGKYLQAIEATNVDEQTLREELESLNNQVNEQETKVEEATERTQGQYAGRWEKDRLKDEKKKLFDLRADRIATAKKIERIAGAEAAKKRFKPQLERAIADGTLSDYADIFTAPELYLTAKGKVIRDGFTYVVKTLENNWEPKGPRVENIGTVVSLDKDGMGARCLMLTDNGAVHIGGTQFVEIDNFVRLADVNQSEQQLVSKARSGIQLADITHEFTREEFYQLIDQGDLKRFVGVNGGVAVENGTGKLINVYEFKSDDYKMLYPDLTDDGMKNRLLDLAIKQIEEKGRTDFDRLMGDYVGRDWMDIAYERGNSATQEVIQKQLSTQIIYCEDTYKDSYNKAMIGDTDSYFNHVDDVVKNIDWEGYVNRAEIRQSSNKIVANYQTIIRERSYEFIKDARDSAFAAYTSVCSSDPSRNDRMIKVSELMQKYVREHNFMESCRELYPENANQATIMIYADLTAMGRKDPLSNGDLLYNTHRNNVLSSAMWEWRRVFTMYKRVFMQDVDALQEKNIPAKEDVPVTGVQKEKIENIGDVPIEFSAMVDVLSEIGITAKINSDALAHVYRGRKTDMPANSYICLFDKNGRKGALGKTFAGRRNADNKEEFSALYSVDISDEFTGSWWFVPTNNDLTALTSRLQEGA